MGGDVSYTCETAGHFFLYQIMARWEKYSNKVKPLANKVGGAYLSSTFQLQCVLSFQPEGLAAIVEQFPFTRYFSNAPQPIFKGDSFSEDWDIAEVGRVIVHTCSMMLVVMMWCTGMLQTHQEDL